MGHQLKAGHKEICFTSGAQLVCSWCDPYHEDLRPWDQKMGSTRIPADAVKNANYEVPMSYNDAYVEGLVYVSRNKAIDERNFLQCRGFLKYAADHGLDITGSY